MKFSTFLLPAFVASALASPVQPRDSSSLSSILGTLQTSVLAHDASLNKTAASLTRDSSEDDRAAAVASTNSDLKGLTSSIQAATSSIKNLSAAERGRYDSKASQLIVENIYADIYNTISSVPRDTLASASPDALKGLVSGLGDFGFLLGSLLTGVINLVVNVLQLVVGVIVATVPGLLDGVS